ncbi:LamG domain-containing protein [bacterium]|nr:LamG domain-containing protein [bacterium]
MGQSRFIYLTFLVFLGAGLFSAGCDSGSVNKDDGDDASVDDDEPADDDDEDVDPDNGSFAVGLNGFNEGGIVPFDPRLDLDVFTIECWFNIDEKIFVDQLRYEMVGRENPSPRSESEGWSLSLLGNRVGDTIETQLFFIISDRSAWWPKIFTDVNLTIGQWYHAAGVYDGQELRLYLDGELLGTKEYDGPVYYDETPLGIGQPSVDDISFFPGLIDEVRYSSVARYDAAFDPFFEFGNVDEDTVGLWHFNEGAGDVFHDMSANQLHGALTHNDLWVERAGD